MNNRTDAQVTRAFIFLQLRQTHKLMNDVLTQLEQTMDMLGQKTSYKFPRSEEK